MQGVTLAAAAEKTDQVRRKSHLPRDSQSFIRTPWLENFFELNPVGAKGDALFTGNGADFNRPWDGIWEGRTSIDADGWSAEFALPFETLSFEPGLETWGFNVERHLGRRDEVSRWATPRRNVRFLSAADAGDLTGLEGIRQGPGGLHRAAEVAGLDPIDAFGGQCGRERLRLRAPEGAERRVGLALPDAARVPVALAVPDDQQLGGSHGGGG